MKNSNTIPLATKVAIIGLLLLSIGFVIACYNSIQETEALVNLTLGK